MAKQTAAPGRSQEEINDAAEQSMLSAAMGFTEREIFEDAMALPEDDDDGDRSLEAMGEGHDDMPVDPETGEELDNDADPEFVDPATMEEVDPITGRPLNADAEGETARREGEAGADDRVEDRLPPQGDQPSWLRPSDQQIDPQIMELRERLARAEGALSARAPTVDPARPAPTAPAIPDPVVDPEGFQRHLEERDNRLRTSWEQAQQNRETENRLRSSFENWENNYRDAGREQEFYFASQVLDRMSQTGNPNDVRIVRSIVQARDPARALMQWAENNLDMDGVRAEVANREDALLAQQLERRGIDPDTVLEGRRPVASDRQPDRGQQRRDPGTRGGQNGRQQPQRSRLPSLNSAPGGGGRMGGNSRNLDPRGFDGSDSSIFNYAMNN